MSAKKPSYEELEKKLAKAEQTLAGLKGVTPPNSQGKRAPVKGHLNTPLPSAEDLKEAYIASEQNFKNSMDASPLGIRIVTDDGALIYANKAILDICGYKSVEELAAVPRSQLYTPESYAAHQQRKMQRKLKKHVPAEYEINIRRPDGEVRDLQVFRREVMWGGEQQFMAMYQDITEHKRAEQALRESEEKFHSIVEHGNDGIIFIQEGIIRYCNSKMLEISDYAEDELLGKPFIDFVAPEHKDMAFGIYSKRIAGKKTQDRYELNLLGKGGRKVYAEISASLINYKQNQVDVAIIRDVTERKNADEALAGETLRRRILIEQSSDGIVILDNNGKVYEANQRFADMLGYSPEEVRQLCVFDWEFQYPHEQTLNMIRSIDEKGDHFETKHRRKDGTIYDVEISTNGASFAGQKLIFCVCRDITERKRMEQELRQGEDKFSKAFRSSPDAIIISRIADGKILEVNDAWEGLLGYSREEVLEKSSLALNLLNPLDRQHAVSLLEKQGFVREFELEVRHKSGDVRQASLSIEKIEINSERCMLTILHDITESKLAEEELKNRERFFNNIIENSPSALWVSDKKGTVIRMNQALRDVLNVTDEEVIRKYNVLQDSQVIEQGFLPLVTSVFEEGKTVSFTLDYYTAQEKQVKPAQAAHKVLEIVMSAIKDEAGKVINVICQEKDITEQERARTDLLESEEKFNKAFQASPNLMAIISLPEGRIIDVNAAYCKITGYSREELVGNIALELNLWVNSEQRDEFYQLVSTKGRLENLEVSLRTKADEIRTFLFSAEKITLYGAPCLVTVALDITERKRAEAAIHQSEERFRQIFQEGPLGIGLSTLNYQFTMMNDRFYTMFGYTEQEFLSMTFKDISFPEDIPGSLSNLQKLAKGELKYYSTEKRYIKKNKEVMWGSLTVTLLHDSSGKPQGFLAMIEDITERKQAEQRVIHLNLALHSISDVSQLITREKDRDKLLKGICDAFIETRSFHTAWIALFDESQHLITHAESGVRGDFTPMVKALKRGKLPHCVQKALAQNQVVVVTEPKIMCIGCPANEDTPDYGSMAVRLECDGNIYGALCVSMPREMLADENELTLFHEVAADIAFALYNMEREDNYRRLEQERLRAAKLESIGTLAGGIAHDFNNLLTGIMGNIGLAKSQIASTDAAYEVLDEAEGAALRARDLTQQLLTFARGGKPVKKLANVAGIIKDAATFALRGSNAKLELALPEDLWLIEADEGQVSQVINNLVINADEAMSSGGTLKIRAENFNFKKPSGLPLSGAKYVHIAVEDSGVGISPEHLQRIFEPYFTTKQRGSGLGLTTAYSIVRNHGGIITAESKPNIGSVFHIYFPAVKRAVKGGKKLDAANAGQAGGKILVMDDEEIIRKMLKNMLSMAGYVVELSADGAEALAKYQQAIKAGDPFNAVIMDLTIPGGMGGREAVKKLLEIDPHATVIVSSGYATDAIMSEYKKYGFKAVIAKPYSVKQLQGTLSGILTAKKK